jgi:DNA (cytosine-5)-methyltransferase 1
MFIMKTQERYSAIESFCGAGGLALGLHSAGFKIMCAFDNDEKSIETYRHNIGEHAFVADASKLDGKKLLKDAKVEHLDLFSGGPPCQGFSKQRRMAHELKDERNKLVIEYARLVNEMEPRSFLLENVSMLGQKRGKAFIKIIHELLGDYTFTPHFYNSADYGLAQTRERFILVGIRKDVEGVFIVPKPTVRAWRTIRDVIGGMPEPPNDYSEHPDFLNHQNARVTEMNIERFSHVPQGGGWADIPENLRLECHKGVDRKTGGWPDVYGRLKWNGQCPTITGGFDSFTRGRYGHPEKDRPLTPREAARLQGFPDSFKFIGTRSDVRKQIGNAVPPPLAEAIGKSVVKALMMADGEIKFKGQRTVHKFTGISG